MTLHKIISCSLSPNTQRDDYLLALKTLFNPWMWQRGAAVAQVEEWFKDYFQVSTAVSFNSGRAALLELLRSLNIGQGDEVLLQAFTCVAVPNSVLWSGAKPVYVDIDESYNLDPTQVEKKITRHTRALIVQHTFGIPAQMTQLLSLAKKYHLIVIEDCAHSLGVTFEGKKIGALGDAAFFSFGRDKVISSVWGGVATINKKCKIKNVKLKLEQFQKELKYPNRYWIFQQLLHPLAFSFILMSYNILMGKILLFFLQCLHLLSFPVYTREKYGLQPKQIPAKFPNALAGLLLNQLNKLDSYGKMRRQSAGYYESELKEHKFYKIQRSVPGVGYLRYPILVSDPQMMITRAKQKGILLGNWYHNVIDPVGVDFRAIGYQLGSCPKAEGVAKQIINLPTLITSRQREYVIKSLFYD